MTPEQEKYFKAWLKTQMDIGAVSNPIDAERAWEAAILTERERCAKILWDLYVADGTNMDTRYAYKKAVKAIRGE